MDSISTSLVEEVAKLLNDEKYEDGANKTEILLKDEKTLANSEELWLLRAISFLHLGKYDECEKSLDQSLLCNPSLGIAFAVKGNLYFTKKSYSQAMQAYNKANDLNAKVDFYDGDTPDYLLREFEFAIDHYEYAFKRAGSSPNVVKRKRSIEAYEKLKTDHVFDMNSC